MFVFFRFVYADEIVYTAERLFKVEKLLSSVDTFMAIVSAVRFGLNIEILRANLTNPARNNPPKCLFLFRSTHYYRNAVSHSATVRSSYTNLANYKQV